MRRFNVAGLCIANKHYMVDTSKKLAQIKTMIDYGSYFTINRARQYGKTTTLHQLEETLKDEYIVISISFEGLSNRSFESPESFCPMFLRKITKALSFTSAPPEYIAEWLNKEITDFEPLSEHITKMGKDKKLVLLIDEVDKTSNNQIFLHFLGMLRDKYLEREKGKDYTFHSVILAGVYDIKNIKLKMINEGTLAPAPDESKIYNSPWNIAVNFNVDMSFDPHEIATMLREYEADHNTGMDIMTISDEIFKFTGGYPFLVSRICQAIDEELGKDWTLAGVRKAISIILDEKNTLFDDIYKNLENNPDLYSLIYDTLILGESYGFKVGNPVLDLAHMYGIIKNVNGAAVISNQIFEKIIYEYLISTELTNSKKEKSTGIPVSSIVKNGRFDMQLCLEKFAAHYYNVSNKKDLKFLERQGQMLFLTFLSPLLNGHGYAHVESETRNQQRMDIVLDYGCDQFIIELKIWYGDSRHQDAYEQLLGYMDSKNAAAGYLLTFDFRKEVNKQRCAKWIDFDGGKRIFDVVL
ncbi:MAG: AAA-like domain-containing protein [Clostridiales bacterium]|nr:AAA-like domain-containing protein [Clostridiales bacterium]